MSSSSRLSLDFAGMVTAPGQLAAPTGSLTVATNFVFPAPGMAEKRHGIAQRAYGLGGGLHTLISSKQLGSNLLAVSGTLATGNTLKVGDGTAAWVSLSTPDSTNPGNTIATRMKAAVTLKNHMLTSSRASMRLESNNGFFWAGMPRPPAPVNYNYLTAGANNELVPAAGNWLPVGNFVAYRVVWGAYDADGVLRLSPPSGRYITSNTSVTSGYTGANPANVQLAIPLPHQSDTVSTNIPTSWVMQLYRCFSTSTGSPSDEMQLVYQASPTAGEVTLGVMIVTDSTPEAAMGAYLYTNTVAGGDVSTGLVRPGSTGLGLLASNDRPPIATDVATYADCVFWANTTTPQRQLLSILAVGAAGNVLKATDVLTIAGSNYTAVATNTLTSTQFKVETGLGSVTANLRGTAINLCSAININASATVTATYIGSDASPGAIGQILLETKRTDAASFTVTTTGSGLPYLPTLGTTSTQDVWGNGLAISKPFQGDAVPPANYLRVGRNDTVIQRIIALRDALFIFTDSGIFWIRGTGPADFVLDSFDNTFRLLARECCVVCNDAIYAWGYEGIARITNGGVEFLDTPIRNYVKAAQFQMKGPTSGAPITSFQNYAFAVAYPITRRILFFFPMSFTAPYGCVRALAYSIATNAWSLIDYGGSNRKSCGVVRWSDEVLHLGELYDGTDSKVYNELNGDIDGSDFVDTTTSGSTQAITSQLQWTSTVDAPNSLAHWQEAQLYFSDDDVSGLGLPTQVSLNVLSEHGGSQTTTVNLNSGTAGRQARVMLEPAVGMAARQVVSVTHSVSGEPCTLSGFALLYKPVSSNITR